MKATILIVVLNLAFLSWVEGGEHVYKQPSEFIKDSFGGSIPETSVLNLSRDDRSRARNIMAHDYGNSRVRYWKQGSRSVWILEEIGKTEPITTGILIENGHITCVEILIYRESHGWEVSRPFFTKQFAHASLRSDGRLSADIRNIAGATLSVRAVTKLARLALYFDSRL